MSILQFLQWSIEHAPQGTWLILFVIVCGATSVLVAWARAFGRRCQCDDDEEVTTLEDDE